MKRTPLPEKDSIITLSKYGAMCLIADNVLNKLKNIEDFEYLNPYYDDVKIKTFQKAIRKAIKIVQSEKRWAKRNKDRINDSQRYYEDGFKGYEIYQNNE